MIGAKPRDHGRHPPRESRESQVHRLTSQPATSITSTRAECERASGPETLRLHGNQCSYLSSRRVNRVVNKGDDGVRRGAAFGRLRLLATPRS